MLGQEAMNAVLRKANPSDFENLLRLYAPFEPKRAFGGLPPLTPTETERGLRALRYNGYHQFVPEAELRLVGQQCIIFTQGLPVTVAMPKLFW